MWGMICALIATVESPKALIAIRFFLGMVEGGFLPGVVFWLGSWYPRQVQGRRFAVLYSTVSVRTYAWTQTNANEPCSSPVPLAVCLQLAFTPSTGFTE